ncbi:hypothetical protein VIGAN_11177600 [Vigna angularis var. angularis]|uniref:Dirigent protein n=1 Tax=Vigna angularis var. angularis TaxID=157739 RepID=A0A0S3TB88_PHAAN|nr:hypothetical protein VIGAN_11177600 [Vigna angularis var. angularis]
MKPQDSKVILHVVNGDARFDANCRANGKRPFSVALCVGILVLVGVFALVGVILLLLEGRKKRSGLQNKSRNVYSSSFINTTSMESGGVYFGISVFSFDELREATNNFDEARKFGEGGPEPTSKVVGRIEGLVAGTSQREFILVVLNFVFTEGNYNGSTITVLGRNRITQNIREIPVIGGTGVFRFATGYAETNTIFLDPKMRSTIEYNIFKNPKLYK